MVSGSQLVEVGSLLLVAKTSNEILSYLKDVVSQDTVIFIDIDDTVITPISKAFRRPPYNRLIDDIKKDKDKYKNYTEIVSNWRLQRRVMLIDHEWPNALSTLMQRYRVYGLTKMDHGKFGNIDSMEKWRYSELKSLGIEFSDDSAIPQDRVINDALFYNGLFITGSNSKSQTISHYLQYLKPSTIIIIDDREEHLEDVKQFSVQHSINFVGILFNGLAKFEDKIDSDVVCIQKQYLIDHAKWLEDDEAEKIKIQRISND